MTGERLGLNPQRSSGLLTAARMKNAAFEIEAFQGLEILTVATAGVDINGGRAGDPASYVEEEGSFVLFRAQSIFFFGEWILLLLPYKAMITAKPKPLPCRN